MQHNWWEGSRHSDMHIVSYEPDGCIEIKVQAAMESQDKAEWQESSQSQSSTRAAATWLLLARCQEALTAQLTAC